MIKSHSTWIAALATVALPNCASAQTPDLSVAARFVAKETCSVRFLAGYGDDRLAEDLSRFEALPFISEVDLAQGRVAVRTLDGIERGAALHRPGVGCVVLNADSSIAIAHGRTMAAMGIDYADSSGSENSDVIGTPTGYADDGSVDRAAISTILDEAFSEPDSNRARGTRAVVVVHDGRIVAERYATGFNAETRMRGWSMAKSVTAALVGVMMEQGRLDLLGPVRAPEWDGDDDPRNRIVLLNLLEMTTGLEFDESYDGTATDAAHLIFAATDAGGFAAAKPLVDEPGRTHRYSSGTTNILSRLLRQAVGDDRAYWRFPRTELFEPIGATSAVLETDPSGTFVGSSFAWATARDWARLGQLYLQNGVWGSRRIMVDGWSAYVGNPIPGDPDGRRGVHFAINAGGRWPTVPPSLYLMSGLDGQYVFIAPSHRAVVVRLGQTPGDGFDAETFIAGILDALPAIPPMAAQGHEPRPDTLRALLVGNSYTYVNNLPAILGGIAGALPEGPIIEADMVVRGGARLSWHARSEQLDSTLTARPWDVVTLQGQSRLLPEVELMTPEHIADTTQSLATPEHLHDGIRQLVPRIRAAGARPILFQTWARRHLPEQTRVLEDAYTSIGRELAVDVSPIGTAWSDAMEEAPDLNLFWFDRSHPGPAGSYLAALVLYASITGRSPVGAPSSIVGYSTNRVGSVDQSRLVTLVDLPVGTAQILQRVAAEAVLGRR